MGQGNSTHPILSAGRTGDVSVVRRYVKNPAILNRRDVDDMTCLHWAAQLGHIDIIRELTAAKAMLDVQDVNGWTPLMHACCRGHKLAVGALLAAGASVDVESCDGRTALHRAATWNRVGPLDQLIEAGGDVRHEAHNKWTPLHCAAAAGDAHSCAILVDAGADADAEDASGLKPMDVVADISSTNSVSQALARGQRDARICAQQRSLAFGKLAKPLPVQPPSQDSPPVNASTTGLGKYSLRVDTGGPVPTPLDLGRTAPPSAAFEKGGPGGPVLDPLDLSRTGAAFEKEDDDRKSGGGEGDLLDRKKSDSTKNVVPAVKQGGSNGVQPRTTVRRGSWTRPAEPGLGPKCGLDGVDVDGPFSPPESSGRARRRRSKKVAVVVSGGRGESDSRKKSHDHRSDREVVRDVAIDFSGSNVSGSDSNAGVDVVGRNPSGNNNVGIDVVGGNANYKSNTGLNAGWGGPTDPLCLEERGYSSAQAPSAHRQTDVVSGSDQPADVASLSSRADGSSDGARVGTGKPADNVERG